MSGTSMDGIDAVLVSFQNNTVTIHASHTTPYPDQIRHRLLAASQNQAAPDEVGELDTLVGTLFSEPTTLRRISYAVFCLKKKVT